MFLLFFLIVLIHYVLIYFQPFFLDIVFKLQCLLSIKNFNDNINVVNLIENAFSVPIRY